jgi:hypothetical protein
MCTRAAWIDVTEHSRYRSMDSRGDFLGWQSLISALCRRECHPPKPPGVLGSSVTGLFHAVLLLNLLQMPDLDQSPVLRTASSIDRRLARQIPASRHTSTAGNPASACFKTATICSTAKRSLFTANLSLPCGLVFCRKVRQKMGCRSPGCSASSALRTSVSRQTEAAAQNRNPRSGSACSESGRTTRWSPSEPDCQCLDD